MHRQDPRPDHGEPRSFCRLPCRGRGRFVHGRRHHAEPGAGSRQLQREAARSRARRHAAHADDPARRADGRRRALLPALPARARRSRRRDRRGARRAWRHAGHPARDVDGRVCGARPRTDAACVHRAASRVAGAARNAHVAGRSRARPLRRRDPARTPRAFSRPALSRCLPRHLQRARRDGARPAREGRARRRRHPAIWPACRSSATTGSSESPNGRSPIAQATNMRFDRRRSLTSSSTTHRC